MTVRSVLAGFGVVLSARALGDWIETALKSKQITAEQRESLDQAAAAMGRLNTEAQKLAGSIATELAPAIENAANWWRRFLFPNEGEQADEEIRRRQERINELAKALIDFEEGRAAPARGQSQIANMRAEVEQLRGELMKLYGVREQLRTQEQQQSTDKLELFDLQAIGSQRLPVIRDFNKEVEAVFAEAAEKRRATQERERELQLEQLTREFELVRESTLTREEMEREAIQRRLDILRTAHDQGLIDQTRFWELSAAVAKTGQGRLTQIDREGQTARQKFEAMSGKQKVTSIIGTLTDITAGTAQYNKRIFQLNKALGIADAIISTYQGAARALKDYPAPWSFIVAAAVAASGLARVQAIRSTTFEGGGGGTTPSSAGSVPIVNDTPVSAAPSQAGAGRELHINVTVQGSVIGEGGRAALAETIGELVREYIDDRDGVIMSNNSRQASIIRS